MKVIKIFLASSSELKDDRDQFQLFIAQENERLLSNNIQLKLVRWENFLDAISDTRLQDEYNSAISECDIVLCLFFTKVGKYTAEEFDTAYQVFKDKGRPKIWTYFKNAQINTGSITDEINTLLEFKRKIGTLGHFYTEYTNIDNLINKFRTQLDKFLLPFEYIPESRNTETKPLATDKEPVKNTFNVLLTQRLIEAIRPYNKKANDFLVTNGNWESNADLGSTVRRIIISSYVGVLGIQLRKLISIGEEDFSANKMERYLENCYLTAKRGLQLICFALMSKLWDHQLSNNSKLSQSQTDALVKFFKNATEDSITGFAELLKILIEVFSEKKLEFPFARLSELYFNLQTGSSFMDACIYLEAIPVQLKNSSFSANDCTESEKNITVILENLNFLAEYKMISIKDIGYNQLRNEKEGIYLHNYTLLEGDSQANNNNNNQGKVRKETSPVISNAVLLCKSNITPNINLLPFVIDYNALALTGGSKICFYSYCNTWDDSSLIYSFIEDNSKVPIKKSMNPKPDDKDTQAINKWWANSANRKDMNIDNVYQLFYEMKKTLAGIEEETSEDTL